MGEPVFLGYDREVLDREYNNRLKVPSYPEYLARWRAESARAREDLRARCDLRYGPAPDETLDVFLAAGPLPAPVAVFIHGGYWMALDKRDFGYVARAFHPAGAVTAVVNYGLIPAVDMDELVRQCRAAIAWIFRNVGALGGDPDRIFVSGHSAGGHLTAMLLATDWPAFAGLPVDVLKGGTGVSGLYDLEPIRLCYLNETLGLGPAAARRNSPIHLPSPPAGTLLLPVGGLEGAEYHRQTEALAAAWRRPGFSPGIMDMDGLDHFSIVDQLARPDSPLARAIHRQMGLAA